MPSTRRNKKSPGAKRAEMEALHQQLSESVEQLRSGEAWEQYLRFCSAFHAYSLNNLLLILAQREDASHVAGYRAWQNLGRQVRRGERGIRILASSTIKVKDGNGDDVADDDGKPQRRRIFFPVSVFDVSQTEVMEGHDDVSEMAPRLTGADEAGILGRVTEYLTASGVTVTLEPLAGTRSGYTTKKGDAVRVVIDADNDPAQQAKTALHEAAHIVLEHVDDYAEYVQHQGRCEVEAESVAYVVAGVLGLDTATYSTGYVAGWAERAEPDVLKDTAGHTLAAAHTLIEALTPTRPRTT